MLPDESNPDDFIVPPGVVIDDTNALVWEDHQIDTVVFNHLNAQGNLPAVGTLLPSQFIGIGMVQDLLIKTNGPYSGIIYNGIEVLTFNFGNEVDDIYVNETSEAIHLMNLGAG
jgi:hypothetical protein